MVSVKKLRQPGQFDLEIARVITCEGISIDLKEAATVMEIEFSEDVGSNAILGFIVFHETVGATNVGPLIGQEYLQILINTPSLKGKKSKIDFTENLLHVIGIPDVKEVNNVTITTMSFTTSEVIHSKRTRVTRPLEGTFSSLTTTLLQKDLQCKKDLYIETSIGVKHVIPHDRTPFNMIKEFGRQAISKENGSPTYYFYENIRGFNFRSLESLFAEGSKFQFAVVEPGAKTGKKPGLSDGKVMDEKLTRDMAQIIKYNFVQKREHFLVAPSGGLSSNLISHNIFHKNYTSTTYNYFDNRKSEKHINTFAGEKDNPLYSDAPVDKEGRRVSDFTYTKFLSPETEIRTKDSQADFNSTVLKSSQYDRWSDGKKRYVFDQRKTNNWLQRRRSNLLNLDTSGALTIQAHGNLSVACGDIVTLDIPEASAPDSSGDGKSRFYRDTHLVKAITHDFSVALGAHTMHMTLHKDSVKEKFELNDKDGFVETKPVKTPKIFNEEDFYGGEIDYDEE